MAAIEYEDSLLISCRALHYFTDTKLLQKDAAGNQIPAAGAEQVQIAKLLKDVEKDDDDFGLHGIDSILDSLVVDCRAKGGNLAMSENELLDETIIFNVKSLAKWISANT